MTLVWTVTNSRLSWLGCNYVMQISAESVLQCKRQFVLQKRPNFTIPYVALPSSHLVLNKAAAAAAAAATDTTTTTTTTGNKKPELLYDVCHVMLFGLTLRSVIDRTTKIDHVTAPPLFCCVVVVM